MHNKRSTINRRKIFDQKSVFQYADRVSRMFIAAETTKQPSSSLLSGEVNRYTISVTNDCIHIYIFIYIYV